MLIFWAFDNKKAYFYLFDALRLFVLNNTNTDYCNDLSFLYILHDTLQFNKFAHAFIHDLIENEAVSIENEAVSIENQHDANCVFDLLNATRKIIIEKQIIAMHK